MITISKILRQFQLLSIFLTIAFLAAAINTACAMEKPQTEHDEDNTVHGPLDPGSAFLNAVKQNNYNTFASILSAYNPSEAEIKSAFLNALMHHDHYNRIAITLLRYISINSDDMAITAEDLAMGLYLLADHFNNQILTLYILALDTRVSDETINELFLDVLSMGLNGTRQEAERSNDIISCLIETNRIVSS